MEEDGPDVRVIKKVEWWDERAFMLFLASGFLCGGTFFLWGPVGTYYGASNTEIFICKTASILLSIMIALVLFVTNEIVMEIRKSKQ